MFPSWAITWSRVTASSLPTMSATLLGLYFSTHGILGPTEAEAEDEDDAEAAIFHGHLCFSNFPSQSMGKKGKTILTKPSLNTTSFFPLTDSPISVILEGKLELDTTPFHT